MLRITVSDNPGFVTFRLEGKLVGSWVRELQDCWESTLAARPNSAVCVDLTEVTFIDAAGKTLLAAKHAEGAKLVAAGCFTRAIVADISGDPIPDCCAGPPSLGVSHFRLNS